MGVKLALLAIGLLLAAGASGCALQNTFDCLDRHCYLADWCNCNSCASECYRRDGYNHRWACPCQNPAAK